MLFIVWRKAVSMSADERRL